MGRTNPPVTTMAVLVALYAAWHFTGGMHGAVLRVHTPPAVAAVTTAVTTSQCQPVPAAPEPTPSATATLSAPPSPAASTSAPSATQLCIGVDAAQDSVKHGKTATWTIQVTAQDGPATGVIITLAATPVTLTPAFTASCPSGGGSPVCTLGDMATQTTPAQYQLQAQVTIPAASSAQALTVTASASTTPAMAADPAAGQSITITGTTVTPTPKTKPTPTPSTARPTQVQPTQVQPAPAVASAAQPGTLPAIGAMPTPAPLTTTVEPQNVGNAMPQISPVVAATPAPAANVATSPAANIQAAGATPSANANGDTFSINIAMSAQTAQILGWILLALIATLIANRLITRYITRNRPARQRKPETTAVKRRFRLRLPPLRFPRPRPSRVERRATREQNWRRYLASQRPPAAEEAAEAVMRDLS
jgi:hypothetical protein